MSHTSVTLDKLDPAAEWRPWEPDESRPWGRKWAGHLFRRAAFGATPAEMEQALKEGPAVTLDRLFEPKDNADLDKPSDFALNASIGGQQDLNPVDARAWWLRQLLLGRHPLRERMVLFWHNHFATSIAKVQSIDLMLRQNALLREHALGKFGPMLRDMSRDVAMLVWLDSNSNIKAAPNENYAREVMELFSLGVGNYTEKDIREAARAFTGWHTDGDRRAFAFKPQEHDAGRKTVLGQAGDWDGDDVLRILLEQPACGRFLARKLYRYFFSEVTTPPDALLEPVAEQLRKTDYDVGKAVRTMLASRHFFSEHAYRRKVKGPVEFVVGACREVGQAHLVSPYALIAPTDQMGQLLFAPPNVKGWECGKAWLNTSTILARHNFAEGLSAGMNELNQTATQLTGSFVVSVDPTEVVRKARANTPEKAVNFLVGLLLGGDASEETRRRLSEFTANGSPRGHALEQRVRAVLHAVLSSPEYQLA